jgi:hypothetical protein
MAKWRHGRKKLFHLHQGDNAEPDRISIHPTRATPPKTTLYSNGTLVVNHI